MAVEPLLLTPAISAEGALTTRVPLIAYASDRDTLETLSEVLGPALGATASFRLGSLAQARNGLQRLDTPIAALLVDVSGEADPLGALESLAMYVEPGVRVIVIGDVEDMEFYRQIVRGLGVQDYMAKPLTRDAVARTLLPVLTGGLPPPSRSGRLVTVTGVRGGVGATTVAVNLATLLADRARHHVLLFDTNVNYGAAALMLGTEAGGGLRDALETPGRVDMLFAERATPAVSDRLHLLAAEESLDEVITPAKGAVEHLLTLLGNRFNFVVADLPAFPTAMHQEVRMLAHVRVLVMDATLPSLRDTLRHLGVARGARQAARPIVVLNQVGAPGALTRKQVVEGLGAEPDAVIPWLPKQIRSSITLGQPLARRRGPLQTAISQLADEILPQKQEPRKSWLPWRTRAAA